MELKRYVMDSTNTIYDLEKQSILGDGNKDGSGYSGYELKVGRNMRTTRHGTIIKTSDNILELVEVGDWMELKNDTRMVHIHNQRLLDDFLSKVQEPEEDEFKIKDNIVAIYKRQRNGDYKYYEVKQK